MSCLELRQVRERCWFAEHVSGIEDREVIIASSVVLSEELIEGMG